MVLSFFLQGQQSAVAVQTRGVGSGFGGFFEQVGRFGACLIDQAKIGKTVTGRGVNAAVQWHGQQFLLSLVLPDDGSGKAEIFRFGGDGLSQQEACGQEHF